MLSEFSKELHFDLVLPRVKASSVEEVFTHCLGEVSPHVSASAAVLKKGLLHSSRYERSLVGNGLVMSDMRVRGLARPFLALASLEQEVDFKAPDGVPVNVVSFLFSPAREGNMHLQRVFRLSRLIKNADMQRKIVEAEDEVALRSLLEAPAGWMIAA